MVSENNCSHGREHSHTKTCLRQKVALEEYTKRVVYQGGHVWGQYIHVSPNVTAQPWRLVLNKNRRWMEPKIGSARSLMHHQHISRAHQMCLQSGGAPRNNICIQGKINCWLSSTQKGGQQLHQSRDHSRIMRHWSLQYFNHKRRCYTPARHF